MKIMNKNIYFFKGKSKEFIFIDLDDKTIISSQNCFSLMDLEDKAVSNIVKNFDYKEV